MEYKSQESLRTGIHTRISDTVRISSGWRNYSNENFSTNAWETFLWDGDKIIGEYDTLKNADAVIDLHQEILKTYEEGESL
jgi:hypothetical protein